MKEPRFAIDTADAASVQAHLLRCADSFIPPLRERVDVARYSEKIALHATTFEAWNGGALIGLVAAYANDPSTGFAFVTSVSVDGDHVGRGIARQLIRECLAYATSHGFDAVRLEVATNNEAALRLYESSGFRTTDAAGTTLTMQWQHEPEGRP